MMSVSTTVSKTSYSGESLRSGGTVESGSDDGDLAAAVAGGRYRHAGTLLDVSVIAGMGRTLVLRLTAGVGPEQDQRAAEREVAHRVEDPIPDP